MLLNFHSPCICYVIYKTKGEILRHPVLLHFLKILTNNFSIPYTASCTFIPRIKSRQWKKSSSKLMRNLTSPGLSSFFVLGKEPAPRYWQLLKRWLNKSISFYLFCYFRDVRRINWNGKKEEERKQAFNEPYQNKKLRIRSLFCKMSF